MKENCAHKMCCCCCESWDMQYIFCAFLGLFTAAGKEGKKKVGAGEANLSNRLPSSLHATLIASIDRACPSTRGRLLT